MSALPLLRVLTLLSVLTLSLAYPFAEFVARCPLSHTAMDDPIVFPGQPGRSHVHRFFGSTVTNAYTNSTCSILSSPTTCDVGGDRTSYWTPALLDPSGAIVAEKRATFYYQSKNLASPANTVRLPNGLKMISGNASATGPSKPSRTRWSCQGESVSSNTIVQCSPGNPNLEAFVQFPECWDGVSLDSPDHKSHVAFASNGVCPSTHPVQIPSIEFKIVYNTVGGPGYRLASGSGYTLHADVWVAWVVGDQEMRVANCIRKAKKCGINGLPNDGSTPVYRTAPYIPSGCANSSVTATDREL